MPDEPDFEARARIFLNAQGEEQRHLVKQEDYAFDAERYPKEATMAELTQLIGERQPPSQTLIIGGPGEGITQQVNDEVDFECEERIRFLIDRLGQEQESFEAEFDQAHGSGYDLDP